MSVISDGRESVFGDEKTYHYTSLHWLQRENWCQSPPTHFTGFLNGIYSSCILYKDFNSAPQLGPIHELQPICWHLYSAQSAFVLGFYLKWKAWLVLELVWRQILIARRKHKQFTLDLFILSKFINFLAWSVT